MFIPVIMAGGMGRRLWPLSKPQRPKQFLSLVSRNTLLQDTLLRLQGLQHHPPLLTCNQQHRALAEKQLQEIGINDATLLVEPAGHNTAPAVALAALYAQHALPSDPDPVLLALPSDHLVADKAAFQATVRLALPLAESGLLVTFGVQPEEPHTGYGYIQRGKALGSTDAFQVEQFMEKPDADTAAVFVAAGNYLWNSGMFMFRTSAFLSEMQAFEPAILAACKAALDNGRNDSGAVCPEARAFSHCPAAAIDTAVMEHTEIAAVVPLEAGWQDVGSWSALRRLRR
ncbi:hypothetical protein E4656_02040 [Natronospirillum operosum]|uniref:Nucleotidyl transferase domain-containing protein n=1 Tax=Natronospirillum operosum TaxID=2759953 RepID=A0A4Z0WBP1_9GAMM|nr:sugar phosphate nucleotidyltransferase [Natronospirillum operosum]TGG95224.1 hypothetical protein E4656_02040 [Natronospirillum operosum]